jgi:hypothetical protein
VSEVYAVTASTSWRKRFRQRLRHGAPHHDGKRFVYVDAPDIFAAMRARVDLAHAALPGKVIDTDDWTHSDYDMWIDYTSHSHTLGVPCILYAERFMQDWQHEPAAREIPLEDLRRIADAWRDAGF